jgi:hypothetical protein
LGDEVSIASVHALEMSARNGPETTVLTRGRCPYSAASDQVIALRAALALPYGITPGVGTI